MTQWPLLPSSLGVLLILCHGLVTPVGCDDVGANFVTKWQPQHLGQHNFLVGIAHLGALEGNSTQCGRELEMLLEAIENREIWAIKVLDYFGTPPSTFMWGNYFWFRNPQLCDDVNQPFVIHMAQSQPAMFNVTSPVQMHFAVVYMNFSTPFFINLKMPFESYINVGLCLPKTCNANRILNLTNAYFQSQLFDMQHMLELNMKAVQVKVPHFSWRYFQRPACVIFLLFSLIFISLPLMAEIHHKKQFKQGTQHAMNGESHHDAPPPPPPQCEVTTVDLNCSPLKSLKWQKLLMCFRLVDNCAAVTSLENSNSKSLFITAMAGMRSIMCLWITVFHVYYYSLFAMSNTPFIHAKLEQLAFQPIMQAYFYVDVFFVMSSFLMVYNFLSNTKQEEKIAGGSMAANVKLFLRCLLQRYLRLTPVMILTMLLGTMVLDFLNMNSPFHLGEHSGLYCKTTWWYNLLYIHNLLDMNCICCSWTWYLACEMQYYGVFMALLFVHVKHPRLAKISFVTLAVGCVAFAWLCNFTNGITFQIDVIYSTLNQLYAKPWVRIMPYLGGAVMGWCMHTIQLRQQRAQQHPTTVGLIYWPRLRGNKIFWSLSFVLYVATNFMSYWRSTPTWAVATIMSVGKLIFAVWMGAVIVVCARCPHGFANSVLSARVFLVLNKFCFSIYMLAPVLVFGLFGLRNEATNFTEVGSGADFMAVVLMALVSGSLVYVLVELPLQRVTKIVLS